MRVYVEWTEELKDVKVGRLCDGYGGFSVSME